MSDSLRVVSVVGARPNFMKAAPVARAFESREGLEHLLVHTGQHYDENMSDVFFRDLGMSPPDISLGVGSGSHAEQTARIMTSFESEVCRKIEPDMVLVYGDVNSTVAAALVSKKLHIPVAHVESGLRSGDRMMPEEVNRVIVDAICDIRFVTEESGRRNLLREGIDEESISFVGNTMIDSLARLVGSGESGAESGDPYLVLTLHRPSNVDDQDDLRRLIEAIEEGAGDAITIRFPVHPRTEKVMEASGLLDELKANSGWDLSGPVGYREFIGLVRGSTGVVTDSGGIQEETTWLGVPCVTLRESTERPSTIELGTNRLVGVTPEDVREAVSDVVAGRHRGDDRPPPPLWDGRAAGRVVRRVLRYLND